MVIRPPQPESSNSVSEHCDLMGSLLWRECALLHQHHLFPLLSESNNRQTQDDQLIKRSEALCRSTVSFPTREM